MYMKPNKMENDFVFLYDLYLLLKCLVNNQQIVYYMSILHHIKVSCSQSLMIPCYNCILKGFLMQ